MPSHAVTPDNLNVEEPSGSLEKNIKMEMSDDVLELEKEIADMESSTNILIQACKKNQKRFDRSKFMDTYESWHDEMKAKYQDSHTFDRKFRLHCLNLYCKAPKAYPIFKRTFSLPSVKTLKKTKINLAPGINKKFINLVGKLLQNVPKSKHVVVCLEEIPINKHLYYDLRHDNIIGFHDTGGKTRLKEVADCAFVISIKGCCVNYHQLIGYCLINTSFYCHTVNKWLDYTIRQLLSVNLHVCAVVSKQSTGLETLAKSKGVGPDNPCFELDGNVIYYIFDLPQMINAVRDSLVSCDFLYDNKTTSWDHLKMFYQTEMDKRIKLAPKLTCEHLNPSREKRTQLQLTEDVFSFTVAAAMASKIDEGCLPTEAQGTVDFFMKMNDLINICNSTSIKNPNKYRRAFRGADYQRNALSHALSLFQNIKVINRTTGQDQTGVTSCFGGLVVSINAILRMYHDCRSSGLKYLLTERLNLKSDEMLSSLIQKRKQSQTTDELAPAIDLKRSFSALAMSHLMKNSTLTNCKASLDELILADEDSNDFSLLEGYLPNVSKSSPLTVGTTDYRFELPIYDTFRHIGSYLLEKCYSKHRCPVFKEYMDNTQMLIMDVKTYKKRLQPSKELLAYLDECETIFLTDFDRLMVMPNVGLNFFRLLQITTNEFKPCPCFPLDYLKKLFLRIRLYNTIKFRNRRMKLALQKIGV